MVPWLSRVPWLMAGTSGRKRLIFFLPGVGPEPDIDDFLLRAPGTFSHGASPSLPMGFGRQGLRASALYR